VKGKNGGGHLARRIKQRMFFRGDRAKYVAGVLGVSSAYLGQLLAGDRSFASANEQLLRRVAGYLQLKPIMCFMLAGKIEAADFSSDQAEIRRLTERALDFIAESSYALEAGVERQMLYDVRAEIQQLVLLLYQSATDTRLMPATEEWLYSIVKEQAD